METNKKRSFRQLKRFCQVIYLFGGYLSVASRFFGGLVKQIPLGAKVVKLFSPSSSSSWTFRRGKLPRWYFSAGSKIRS